MLVLGSLILYLKGMRIMMFQLSGFYCKGSETAFCLIGFTKAYMTGHHDAGP